MIGNVQVKLIIPDDDDRRVEVYREGERISRYSHYDEAVDSYIDGVLDMLRGHSRYALAREEEVTDDSSRFVVFTLER